ncbi:hypothetical protein [Flagellimonas taeanensis]|uniref:hypothetical protein n=1 Tax=Flagellimonas taeanensis TaxID=1005926 RepID=UPI0015A57A54|nr:hypothetical protein [Allomuricauda taeanensis]
MTFYLLERDTILAFRTMPLNKGDDHVENRYEVRIVILSGMDLPSPKRTLRL